MLLNTKRQKAAKIVSGILSVLIGWVPALIINLLLQKRGVAGAVLAGVSVAAYLIFILFLFLFMTRKYRRRKKLLSQPFPPEWDAVLDSKVAYYRSLNDEERDRFKKMVQVFLGEILITGIGTAIDDTTRLLVAASAVIPILHFPEWEYDKLSEVLIYPSNFDEEYSFEDRKDILGMVVGDASVVILSKPSLYHGFSESRDGHNVGIHEFMHKVDEADGAIDGIPALLADKGTIGHWRAVMMMEMEQIRKGNSDINNYALTDESEFFPVVSEYFFEKPEEMSEKHPELYRVLRKIFRQDLAVIFRSALRDIFTIQRHERWRNDPCPCGSGKKYKECCHNKE